MTKITYKKCLICDSSMTRRITDWAWYCENCDYWGATLEANVEAESGDTFNQEGVISFLDDIRQRNLTKILDKLSAGHGRDVGLKILDIGCATGIFLKMAMERGHRIMGVEPNPVMAKIAISNGLHIVNGYFPDAIPSWEKYDVITFNDVFEHIPDLELLLKDCFEYLNENGSLVINLPNSNGLFFKLAKFMAIFKIFGPWNRLWQTMFYTPHLHYFNPKSLDKLLISHGFHKLGKSQELDVVNYKGLWGRVSFDQKNGFFVKIVYFLLLIIIIPVLYFFPKDTFFSVYKKNSMGENH